MRGDGDESNSNFVQLFYLKGEDDNSLRRWMAKKTNKYTSGAVQNEMLQVMSLKALREIAACLHNTPFYSIMADETTDISNRKQVVICIRWVNEQLEAHEEFIGLHQVELINAATITSVIKDALLRMNLSLSKSRGQCYDGCSTMSGAKKGVATNIKSEEPRCLFTHCYGHALNLACADSIKRCKIMKDSLDTTYEITKLIKYSPKRDSRLEQIQKSMSAEEKNFSGIRLLCPTRWTVRAESMKSILDNYPTLQELWTWSIENCSDTEMKARIRGVQAQMQRFDFFFGLVLGQCLLQHADSLSAFLQSLAMSAAEGQTIAALTLSTLREIRNDEKFSLFWQKVTTLASENLVDEPVLPRQRRAPRWFEEGSALPEFHTNPEDMYRQIYHEALDLLKATITDRFDQKDFKMYAQCEQLLLKAAKGQNYESEYENVTKFYGSDFAPGSLHAQLVTFSSNFVCDGPLENLTLRDIISYLQKLSPGQQGLMTQVVTLAKLILVMPATNASSERSFSSLRRIKTYLRSTMTQSRLNHIMILHVHKERTDNLKLVDVANSFVANSEHRRSLFGRFSTLDLAKSRALLRSKATQAMAAKMCKTDSNV